MKIFANVSCVNEFANIVPVAFFCDISPELSARIKELSAVVVANDCEHIAMYNQHGIWTGYVAEQEDDITSESFLDLVENDEDQVNTPKLYVSESQFWWSGFPDSDCGDEMQLTTSRMDISILDSGHEFWRA